MPRRTLGDRGLGGWEVVILIMTRNNRATTIVDMARLFSDRRGRGLLVEGGLGRSGCKITSSAWLGRSLKLHVWRAEACVVEMQLFGA